MSTTIEERIATLEKELNDLKQLIQGARVEKDWRKTFGLSANDPGFKDMIRLRPIMEHVQLCRIIAHPVLWNIEGQKNL
jgi:hypothetical protein